MGPARRRAAASLTFVSLALVGVGAGGCDAQDAADGVGGARRVRAHRGHLRHGARGHCAEGEGGQGPAGGWGRLRAGRLGPSHRAKTQALPQRRLGGPRGDGGGVLRVPPPERQPHLKGKSAPLPEELTALKGAQTQPIPGGRKQADGADRLGSWKPQPAGAESNLPFRQAHCLFTRHPSTQT